MRKALTHNVATLCSDYEKIALSFSGGTDSTCLLFSLLDAGKSPVLYTYVVDGLPSEDLRHAEIAARAFDLPLRIATIPADLNSLITDVRQIVASGVVKKVHVQCIHGHHYVAPLVDEPLMVNGSGIDGLYGAYRTFVFDGSKKDKRIFDKARQKHLNNENDDAMLDQISCYGNCDTQVIYPYRQSNIVDLLMKLSWVEINRPRLKWITVKHYQSEYARLGAGYFRPRGSQQIIAGTRALHDLLLRSPLNKMGRKRVGWIYKDIAAGRV